MKKEIKLPENEWISVPNEYRSRWQHIFQRSQESLNLSTHCPICDVVDLHRWYQIGKPLERVIKGRKFVAAGGLWEWCSNCHCFEHYSCLVPDWLSCDLDVDTRKLTVLPSAIEEARQAVKISNNINPVGAGLESDRTAEINRRTKPALPNR